MTHKLVRSLYKYLRIFPPRKSPVKTVTIENEAELVRWAHWSERAPLRLLVPPGMLRIQGGFTYDSQHPFCHALRGGEAALCRFYTNVSPASLGEFYHLGAGAPEAAELPPWELPWYERSIRRPPSGEVGISADHGVSFYGPASQRKIEVEVERMRKVAASIRETGYQPDAHGDIGGYVLRSGDRACFFIRGGKHRAAALTHLGYPLVPVVFRPTFLRVVDSDQAAFWPLVAAGRLNETTARIILQRHLEGRGADGVFSRKFV